MAVTLKLAAGGAAIWSVVMVLTATDRTRSPAPVGAQPAAPAPAELDFRDRYPILIYPPSDEWRRQARAPPEQPSAVADVAPVAEPQAKKESQRRVGCRRVWFTHDRHRYWKCR
ncbi:hypothetical protein [Bradyrhizobium neotropicale]|uniref:hypothetical protein n=1 Tax=Bradyrhizobium neotropicale TaxID=1497615 RepID=UPI001AD69B70|nr:hypothetical protein [Bradyrhizobium neotropicale]MBO4228362.1 hypothetical protein [Bradyrhizobium neotropicale]